MAILAYARVSTQDQDLSGQIEALTAAGVLPRSSRKRSAVPGRIGLSLPSSCPRSRLVDTVIVTKLDRLGRSTRELLDLIERISAAGASFKSLGDPLWDTTSSQGRLLSTLLAAIAEFERELIRERTGEGRKRAMANGVRFGRKPKLTQHQRLEAIARRDAGETLVEIARSYNVDQSMISRLAAQ